MATFPVFIAFIVFGGARVRAGMSISNEHSGEEPITVALVDDSSVLRGILRRILESDTGIKVVGSVSNGEMGVSVAEAKKPDVLILDVEMPVMDGLSALPGILKASPATKVIMCSSLTERGAGVTMKAMSLGAVECIVKPGSASDTGPESVFQKNLIALVKNLGGSGAAKRAKGGGSVLTSIRRETVKSAPQTEPPLIQLRDDTRAYRGKPRIIAIGSSTGGPQALFTVLKNLKGLDVPIVITQHMPETFTKTLTEHIHMQTGIPSHEAEDGMLVEKGHIYVARGGRHMLFASSGDTLKIVLDNGAPENFCKPAVDPMLRSLIEFYGQRVLCAILTGMGSDGMLGARMLVENGGRVIAQDKETSVVWGMPGAVATNGLCSAVLPLNEIGPWLRRAAV